MSQKIISTLGSTASTIISNIHSPITLDKEHNNYKRGLALIAKYCIISALIILFSAYFMHVISYLYKEKVLPYGIGFFRKFFLVVGILDLIVGIFCAVAWNYYV